MTESYGLPRDSAVNYGAPGFPPWVYDLGGRFGLKASTYPGHQSNQRGDIGAAPNPQGLNRGIDWAGEPADLLRFALWLRDEHPPGVEMVIYQDPRTGQNVGYPTWVNYDSDYSGHRDHVHTRFSENPLAGQANTIEVRDTLYADVSEWQVPVDDSYPYRVLCIRSNDGTHRDINWAKNYRWCRLAANAGKLDFFIVYFVWRPNWQDAVATLKDLVGEPHPQMAVMIDVESWSGQIGGDQSDGINRAYYDIATWLGDQRRVIGYGNVSDLDNLWPRKPPGVRLVVAGYGRNPDYPGKIAHQYTDGQGWGGGLPEGAPPFGDCDMNSADGLSPSAFAAACGIGTAPTTTGDDMANVPQDEWTEIRDKVRQLHEASFLPRPSKSRYADPRDLWPPKDFPWNDDGFLFDLITEHDAALGDSAALARVHNAAASGDLIAQHFLDKLSMTPVDPPTLDGGSPGTLPNNLECWNCGKRYPDALPTCPFCGSDQVKPAEAQPRHAAPVVASTGDGIAVDQIVVDQLTLLQKFKDELPQKVSDSLEHLIPVLKGIVR